MRVHVAERAQAGVVDTHAASDIELGQIFQPSRERRQSVGVHLMFVSFGTFFVHTTRRFGRNGVDKIMQYGVNYPRMLLADTAPRTAPSLRYQELIPKRLSLAAWRMMLYRRTPVSTRSFASYSRRRCFREGSFRAQPRASGDATRSSFPLSSQGPSISAPSCTERCSGGAAPCSPWRSP